MTSPRATISTFAVALLLLGTLYFVVVRSMGQPRLAALTSEPAWVIHHTTERVLLDPDAAAWARIEPVKIRLYPQTARAPFGTEERDVWVTGAYTDEAVAFRLEFADATESRDSTSYWDACAIMLLPGRAPAAGQMMGHDAAANIWHWRADRDAAHARPGGDSVQAVHELLASGPGTQGLMPTQTVTGAGRYHEGKWSVVFERRLRPQQEGELALAPEGDIEIAFAVWDGAKRESLSRKSISVLRPLRLGPWARP